MSCYECGWPTLQRVRGGDNRCPRCGTKGDQANARSSPSEQPSRVVKIYTGVFVAMAIILPYLTPLLIKISLANP